MLVRSVVVLALFLSGCYRVHERGGDGGVLRDGAMVVRDGAMAVPDAVPAPTCGLAPVECSGVSALPMLWYPFDGDLTNHGSAAGHHGASTGRHDFVAGPIGSAISFSRSSSVDFPGTAELLASASALTFSVWTRTDALGEGRTALGCRTYDRGFETYASYRGITTCAGDGAGPPRAWGACGTVRRCEGGWDHFVLRWAGPGTEPEVTSDGRSWERLTARKSFPIGMLDLFDGASDLVVGVGAGDGSLARGTLEVDDLRVYDVALPDATVWATTACPP